MSTDNPEADDRLARNVETMRGMITDAQMRTELATYAPPIPFPTPEQRAMRAECPVCHGDVPALRPPTGAEFYRTRKHRTNRPGMRRKSGECKGSGMRVLSSAVSVPDSR